MAHYELEDVSDSDLGVGVRFVAGRDYVLTTSHEVAALRIGVDLNSRSVSLMTGDRADHPDTQYLGVPDLHDLIEALSKLIDDMEAQQ